MATSNSAMGVLCHLANTHNLPPNAVLAKLPCFFSGTLGSLVAAVQTDVGVPRKFEYGGTILADMYWDIIDYQRRKYHHQLPGRLVNHEQFLVKRLFCELSKATFETWGNASRGVDRQVCALEVERYQEFIKHLLYYNDSFTGKEFVLMLVKLVDGLGQLLRRCGKLEQRGVARRRSSSASSSGSTTARFPSTELDASLVIARNHTRVAFAKLIDKASLGFCEMALAVTLLGATENHKELGDSLGSERLSLSFLSQRRSQCAPVFWSTDLGQVISAALTRGDARRFPPTASVWTESFGTVRRADFVDFGRAQQAFGDATARGTCAALTGAQGEHRNNQHKLMARLLHETAGSWTRLNACTQQHLLLQQTVVSAADVAQVQECRQAGMAAEADRATPEETTLLCRSAGAGPEMVVEIAGTFKPGMQIISLHRTILRSDEDLHSDVVRRLEAASRAEVLRLGSGRRLRMRVRIAGEAGAVGWTSAATQDGMVLWGQSEESTLSSRAVPATPDAATADVPGDDRSIETTSMEAGTVAEAGTQRAREKSSAARAASDETAPRGSSAGIVVDIAGAFKPGMRIASLHETVLRSDDGFHSRVVRFVEAGGCAEVLQLGADRHRMRVRLAGDAGAVGWTPVCEWAFCAVRLDGRLWDLDSSEDAPQGAPVGPHRGEPPPARAARSRPPATNLGPPACDKGRATNLAAATKPAPALSGPAASLACEARPAAAACGLPEQVELFRRAWAAGSVRYSGVAEPFRGQSRLASALDSPRGRPAADLVTFILQLPVLLSDVLSAYERVRGCLQVLGQECSAETALMASRGLQHGSEFNLLLRSMDRFMAIASCLHEGLDGTRRQMLKAGRHVPNQLPALQRTYFESFRNCTELRGVIEHHWHKLETLLADERERRAEGLPRASPLP